ncbi:hypothetical protein PMG11_07588 [Penicillium brasilianum]|uniref:Uncharacterized protein n=1 Tax=Penicillium brasilianum TaxID=104259 RepID=A0A0F7TQB3_PENBI|nr:hypothetical protein PMG11_07588 [Penicillium brasilianum]
MMGPSSWLLAILFLYFWGLIHASNLSPCSDKKDPQPIAISLSLDAVTAICVPSLDQAVVLASVHPRTVTSPLPNYAIITNFLRQNYSEERHAKPRRPSGLLSKLYSLRDALFVSKSPSPPEVDERPSSDQIKQGFIEALEWVKNVSLAEDGTNITTAVILFPRFFSQEVRMLVVEASEEAGIRPYVPVSPHNIFNMAENILEQNITSVDLAVHSQKLLIVDYGLLYFDVQTHGRRCKLNYPIDWMGCMSIPIKLVQRLNSTNLDIQQQLDQGASNIPLLAAVHRSRLLMKMDGRVDSSEEEVSEKDQFEKWPLDLDDWWIGQQKEAFIYWNDIKAVEAEYISELSETLDNLLLCLEDNPDEAYSSFDKVIILGNSCERSIIRQAVRHSVGEHTRIIGGETESDILLEALAGARLAFKYHEAEHRIEEDQDAHPLGGHEEL